MAKVADSMGRISDHNLTSTNCSTGRQKVLRWFALSVQIAQNSAPTEHSNDTVPSSYREEEVEMKKAKSGSTLLKWTFCSVMHSF